MRSHSLVVSLVFLLLPLVASAADVTVKSVPVEDWKAVFATVEPARQLVARARIGGTIEQLNVKEGDQIAAGAEVAVVADQKLVLQMQASDQRIRSQQAQRDQAKADFDRIAELKRRGVSSQTQLDQASTSLDVATLTLAAMQAERSVIEQQMKEGTVFAPGAGRVLTVPVSEGRVVLAGETIATLAEDRYILRLRLPERHAQSIHAGDLVRIGARGLGANGEEALRTGRVRLVYPEIQGGLVVADVDVEGLGNYFAGERTRVYVTTGQRSAIVVPVSAVYARAGANFVRLSDGTEAVVQPGEMRDGGVEILSGLRDGDVVVTR
ncbi:efflux RND transporter periplasmic adaptor subunit [Blastochloris viridis]|uniref:Cobalt/zinc/cadmium efflux RND transporter n=1 Tax=Blastochloris viridis TaxID=1079 RepID=A0A0H5BEM4_BLAVI|nr:efflux RND transporter periplasmic adaptor subunit [Blastochloris viridis]ALK09448.1 Multidrug resistance protein MdtA [Blastochloris viridis]BAS00671.1 cobalt/zinc/cadmium efflux RND transporter [Blastochloris viridis]CUU42111.1 multidrug efflux system subunit MdtA [Blastochloris viridis]